jgi:hypothetical protein
MKIIFEGTVQKVHAEMAAYLGTAPASETVQPLPSTVTVPAVSDEDFQKDFGSGLAETLEAKMDGKEPLDDPLPESMQPPKPKKVSRRKPVKEPAKPKPEPEGTGISDSDIQKAASETAMQTAPDVVKEIMKDIGAGKKKLHELSQDERENFLAASKVAIEKNDD